MSRLSRDHALVLVLIAALLAWAWGAHSAPLPEPRRSAPSQVRIAWDNATGWADGRPFTTNDWSSLSTRVYRCPPPWAGDPLASSNWVLSVTVPFLTQTTTVSVTTGVWAFAVHHVHAGAVTNDGNWSDVLTWTNQPLFPERPILR